VTHQVSDGHFELTDVIARKKVLDGAKVLLQPRNACINKAFQLYN